MYMQKLMQEDMEQLLHYYDVVVNICGGIATVKGSGGGVKISSDVPVELVYMPLFGCHYHIALG